MLVDHQPNRLLFVHQPTLTILETDLKGSILHEFSHKGSGAGQWGDNLDNVGYYSRDTLVVTSQLGYFFYTINGKFIRKIASPNKHRVFLFLKKIRRIHYKDRDYLLSCFKTNLKDDQLMDFKSKKYFENFRPYTLFDVRQQTYSHYFGFEPSSMFRQFEYYYQNTYMPLFEYSPSTHTVGVIHSPEPLLYEYDQDNEFQLKRVTDLKAKHFSVDYKAKFGAPEVDLNLAWQLNSRILSLVGWQDYFLASYCSGIPPSKYSPTEPLSELGPRFNKLYYILLKDGKKIGTDIPAPSSSVGEVVAWIAPNLLVMKPLASHVEHKSKELFFIYKLNGL